MQQKYLGYVITGCIALVLVLVLNLNGMAAFTDNSTGIPFETDKSDRTIIKEILVNQQKTHALLKEIKALLQEKK